MHEYVCLNGITVWKLKFICCSFRADGHKGRTLHVDNFLLKKCGSYFDDCRRIVTIQCLMC